MLEKFTSEEIEILRREIAQLDKNVGKSSLCGDNYERLRDLFFHSGVNGIDVYPQDVETVIYKLCDMTLQNFTVKNENRAYGAGKESKRGHTKDTVVRRYSCTVIADSEKYADMFKEVVDIVEKYKPFGKYINKETL